MTRLDKMAAEDVDAPTGAVGTDKTAESETQDRSITKKKLTLEILPLIKEAQQQHGLRHGDFQRYRSYCSRRLRRLRKSLHFCQGNKHKFQQKRVTAERLTDVRFLYIPLVTVERAWSYAMQLKQEANTEPRKRFHLMSRLYKAARTSTELEMLCQSGMCDARTTLEAKAYAEWMHGSLQFELKNWHSAMEHFHNAETIYEKLASALDDNEKILYQQRVDEITPNIRYCAYNVGDESAIQDLKNMRRTVGEDLLAEKLDSLIAQTREKQAATLSEVTWKGRTVPVKQEKVRIFLLNVQESENEIKRASDLDGKVSVYESLLLECKDALQVLRDELQADANLRNRISDGHTTNLEYLYSYVAYLRLSKTIDRNLLLILNLKNKQNKVGMKYGKPQDLIRMYETIIQCLSEMEQLPGIVGDGTFLQCISTQTVAFKAFRCFYIAETFANAKKWVEAIAIFDRCSKYIQDALNSSSVFTEDLVLQLQELNNQVEGQKLSAHALGILGKEDVTLHIAKLNIKNNVALVDRLDEYRHDAQLLSKQPNVSPFPPDFQPIPCKPLFFDLALNHMELPSLDDRLEQKKGGGLTGIVKGWFFGARKK